MALGEKGVLKINGFEPRVGTQISSQPIPGSQKNELVRAKTLRMLFSDLQVLLSNNEGISNLHRTMKEKREFDPADWHMK